MKQICISSDVSSMFIIDNYNEYENIENLFSISLGNNFSIIQIRDSKLELLKLEIEGIIDKLILNRVNTLKVNTEVEYKGRFYSFDFRNNYDFRICALVGLYDLVEKSIQLQGAVYVFNRELFKKYESDSVIAFMRLSSGLTREQICNKYKVSLQNLKGVNYSEADVITEFEAAIKQLQDLGLIFYDKIQDLYKITARGYILW